MIKRYCKCGTELEDNKYRDLYGMCEKCRKKKPTFEDFINIILLPINNRIPTKALWENFLNGRIDEYRKKNIKESHETKVY